MYNVRLGIRKDDTMPPRLLMHAKETGVMAGVATFSRILYDYYQHRG